MKKTELQDGMKVKASWKGKLFIGRIIGNPLIESKKSAQITSGRFISIPILSDTGKILQLPFTSRIDYERIQELIFK